MDQTLKRMHIYIVSDSTGETGEAMAQALSAQFPHCSVTQTLFSQCRSQEDVQAVLDTISTDAEEVALVFHSVLMPAVADFLWQYCREKHLAVVPLYSPAIHIMEEALGEKAVYLPGLSREMNEDYLHKISSIEFAVRFDDGKEPETGLPQADIVLMGVSRTSKTPLSMLLAIKGYHVANLPLVPEVRLPQALDRVGPRRMVGLVIDPERLNAIRSQRLQTLGLNVSMYADTTRIVKELAYAETVFARFACPVIDVTRQTIEETAAQILRHVRKQLGTDVQRRES